MINTPIQVVKIGGSLLTLPDLVERIRRWRRREMRAHHVMLVGGGEPVEAVRRDYNKKRIGEADAHWLCIGLMDENLDKLGKVIPEFPICEYGDPVFAARVSLPGATFLRTLSFMTEIESNLPGEKLPVGWDTTSDAIAGRLAIALRARELHLLKSRLPDGRCGSLEDLAIYGYVDRILPKLKESLPKTIAWDLTRFDSREIHRERKQSTAGAS